MRTLEELQGDLQTANTQWHSHRPELISANALVHIATALCELVRLQLNQARVPRAVR